MATGARLCFGACAFTAWVHQKAKTEMTEHLMLQYRYPWLFEIVNNV